MKIIIAGAGKIGHSVAAVLADEGHDITVIDQDPETIQLLSNSLNLVRSMLEAKGLDCWPFPNYGKLMFGV